MQIDSAQFSLEHPTQYYKESRELRGHKTGGVKTETTPTSTNGHAVGKQVQEQTTKNEEDCYNMSIEDIHNFEEDVDMEVVQCHSESSMYHFKFNEVTVTIGLLLMHV